MGVGDEKRAVLSAAARGLWRGRGACYGEREEQIESTAQRTTSITEYNVVETRGTF